MKTSQVIAWVSVILILSCSDVSDDYELCRQIEEARCDRRIACQKTYPDKFSGVDREKCYDYYREICRNRELASDVEKDEVDQHLDACLDAIAHYDCRKMFPYADSDDPETLNGDLLNVCPFLREEEEDEDDDGDGDGDDQQPAGESCDVLGQNCTDDAKACYPASTAPTGTEGTCSPAGQKGAGEACSESPECQRGYFCYLSETAEGEMCYKMCDAVDGDPGCPGGYTCLDSGKGTIGYCEGTGADAGS